MPAALASADSVPDSILEFQVGFGAIAIAWKPSGHLTRIDWNLKLFADAGAREVPAHVLNLVERLKRYFRSGDPMGRIPWHLIDRSGWTPFQEQVYQAIAEIPHGETRTYGWVADRVGRSTATRAVGQALRNNPLPILIPCHRVVSVASIGGFMGLTEPSPELDLKQRLQRLEQDFLNPLFPFMASDLA
ncbi:MAG: methylated-DNA--[protein]-cysteine S-methyltransferase [Oligoflexia bacterium]|nr:methylated-DNA--[protein]-cysteine S-methyltransferase [Oligoflexia bacterium]